LAGSAIEAPKGHRSGREIGGKAVILQAPANDVNHLVAFFGQPDGMAIVKWLLIIAATSYPVLVAVLYVMQRSMLYLPPAIRMPRPEAILPQAQQVVLDTSDGEKVIVWHAA
jgi:hypothetical protein